MGELAQQVFEGGKDATPQSYYDFKASVDHTRQWIEAGEKVIYEAAFVHDQVLAALDILVRRNGEIHAIEVKSSTSVRNYHLTDASLQYCVMSNAGCVPDRFFLMHINNQYVREGELEPEKLFHLEDITTQVLEKQEEIPVRLAAMKASLNAPEPPAVDIGSHCANPFPCDFRGHCWEHVPADSVFTLYRLQAERKWEYYDQNIYAIKDLPEGDKFTTKQLLQIRGVKEGAEHINKKRISRWLSQFHYPLYFFDFETINPGIPLYNNSRPYQQMPVQYSLHIVHTPGAEPRHVEYLAGFEGDPREKIINRMISDLGEQGDIIAYSIGFEKGKIKALAMEFPQYASQLEALRKRFVDLAKPFQRGWYYTPEMKGRYSIKYVFPALIKNEKLSYSALAISNGGDASTYLQALAEGRVKPENIKQVRKDLLEYCKLDTLAMVEIWKHLNKCCLTSAEEKTH